MKRGRLVLYIEDNAYNARLVERLLNAGGYDFVGAADAANGLVTAERVHPDLILMDVNLPGLDGYEATMKLRSISSLESVPVVAVTANAMPGDRERALASGCDGYITKPIEVDTFIETIQQYLDGRRDRIEEHLKNEYLQEHNLRLVGKLEHKIHELELTNKNLESIVDSRTRALREAQHKVIELERLKAAAEIAGTVAHELRQPLSVIMGSSELLGDRASKGDECHELMRTIIQQVERMVEIIDRLGGIVRYETKPYHHDRILNLETSSQAETSSVKALVVDDEEAIATILARHLTNALGCRVRMASSTDEALLALSECEYDLCFLDVHLPGESGLSLLPALREQHPDMKVILVTGLISERDRKDAISNGAAACLIKPVRRRDLLDAVHHVLPSVSFSSP